MKDTLELSRRDFLKLSGASAGGLMMPASFAATVAAGVMTTYPLHKPVGETPTICPYCAVGCGMVVGANAGKVVNIEGDPDHPISRGSLCSKGGSRAAKMRGRVRAQQARGIGPQVVACLRSSTDRAKRWRGELDQLSATSCLMAMKVSISS